MSQQNDVPVLDVFDVCFFLGSRASRNAQFQVCRDQKSNNRLSLIDAHWVIVYSNISFNNEFCLLSCHCW